MQHQLEHNYAKQGTRIHSICETSELKTVCDR